MAPGAIARRPFSPSRGESGAKRLPQPQVPPGATPACWGCGKGTKAVPTASLGRRRPRDSSCIRNWAHFSEPRSSEALPPRMSDAKAPIEEPTGASMPPSVTGALASVPKRSSALRLRADDTNASLSLLRDSHAYVAGPFRAPVVGLERPSTLRVRPGPDYVGRAPGALPTPHSGGSSWHAMCQMSTD